MEGEFWCGRAGRKIEASLVAGGYRLALTSGARLVWPIVTSNVQHSFGLPPFSPGFIVAIHPSSNKPIKGTLNGTVMVVEMGPHMSAYYILLYLALAIVCNFPFYN